MVGSVHLVYQKERELDGGRHLLRYFPAQPASLDPH